MATNYKIRGQQWRLLRCKEELWRSGIPSLHNANAGTLTLTCNNLGELKVLQDICKELQLIYEQE